MSNQHKGVRTFRGKIIGITGKIGSGKTTLAKQLIADGFVEYGMADPIKEIGRIFGFSNEQLYGTQQQKLEVHEHWGISARTFLQKIGTDVFREFLPTVIPDMKIERTVWADIFNLIRKNNPDVNYVISDVRFLDEADLIRSCGGLIVRTERRNGVTSVDGVEHVHASELQMSQIIADRNINNNVLSKEEAYETLRCYMNGDVFNTAVINDNDY